MKNQISPELNKILRTVRQPARYIGGETGSIVKSDDETDFHCAICFPDLYEIGMSNQAIQILYQMINALPGISCERLFAPAPDFKASLKEANLSLFTLENNREVKALDVLGFTLGSEMAATSILGVLEASGIPLLANERGEGDPIIFCGGPAATNPAPLSLFMDAVYIGEFEEGGSQLFQRLAELKRAGKSRKERLEALKEFPFMWVEGHSSPQKKATRSVWQDFGTSRDLEKMPLVPYFSVQNHGVVEIMRGCPNNCRFCHAGIYYNPCREKSLTEIFEEANYLVTKGGFRDITLSSLSTGDYINLIPLTKILNERFKNESVSISLPSLRVNSFTLDLLEGLNHGKGRKTGLTFAVETPNSQWQNGLNKDVSFEKVVEILDVAVQRGWQLAKFYFMIGLPSSIEEDEASEIIDFIKNVKKRVRIRININVGTFIPKPHTSFQWAPQKHPEKAYETFRRIKTTLKQYQIKVSYQEPQLSWLEGILSRGNKEIGKIILDAYQKGAYLDPWEEYFNQEAWNSALENLSPLYLEKMEKGFEIDEELPWDSVSLRSSNFFFRREYKAALQCTPTADCGLPCQLNCGVCDSTNHLQRNPPINEETDEFIKLMSHAKRLAETSISPVATSKWKILLRYNKTGKSSWISHRDLIEIFSSMYVTSSLKLHFSEGYNPKPKQEFASPLPVGFEGYNEYTSIEVILPKGQARDINFKKETLKHLNSLAIQGIQFTQLHLFPIDINLKKIKLMPLVSGYHYSLTPRDQSPTENETAENRNSQINDYLQRSKATIIHQEDHPLQITFQVKSNETNPQKTLTPEENEKFEIKRIKILTNKATFIKEEKPTEIPLKPLDETLSTWEEKIMKEEKYT